LENLRASGLIDATIWANGLRTEEDCLVFPYRDLDGAVNCFARRRLHKPKVIDGKQVRYIQPKGSALRGYFPIASLTKLRDGEDPVYITEGEKKALALSQLGLAAVGIGGIWCGCKKGTEELIDDLAAVSWRDRIVYIVFDFDEKASTRQEANAARKRLAKALRTAGAGQVFNVELPPGPDGAKQGVDDFLVAQDAMAFGRLVERGVSVVSGVSGVSGVTVPVLGEAAYHGPIGEFIRGVAPYTEATDAGILAHLLPALGTIIGPGPYVCTSGAKQPARVNTVLVGATSTGRKGTALVPVDLLMNLVDGDFWQAQRVNGLATGEGLIARVASKETEEGIEFVEKRLYVVEEEFSKVLAQLRRDGNILSQVLRESYESGNLSVLTRKSPLQANGAHICISGHITPEELYDRFNHVEQCNGFGNRFAWFVVKSDKVLPFCEPIPDSVFQRFAPQVRRIANYRAGRIPLATASREKWEEIYTQCLRPEKPGFAGAMLARGSSMVLRVALIYFLLDPPLRRSQGIAPVHLDAAMAVWSYCEESVQMLFEGQAGTELGDRVLELLANGPMTKEELNSHLSASQKREIAGVLNGLEGAKQIHKAARKGDTGRPATVWELGPNPARRDPRLRPGEVYEPGLFG
jgi:hypothetical protein